MNNDRQKLIDLFTYRVFKYKNSVRYSKSENSKIKRFFYNFRNFGLTYIFYQLVKRRLIKFPKNIKIEFFFGKKMILPSDDINSSVFLMYGISPDKSERKLTLWLIKNIRECDIFYDIGTHMGYYTALFETILNDVEIHSFEANKKLCQYLGRNFLPSSKIYISCMAVANHVGEVDFYDATEIEDSSASSRFPLLKQVISPIKITSTTIDDYVSKGNKPPTIIKFDIEGGETDAIVGATNVLKKYSPRIVMEIWGDEKGRKYSDPAVKKLQSFGYKSFMLNNDGSVFEEVEVDPVGSISGRASNSRDNFLFIKR